MVSFNKFLCVCINSQIKLLPEIVKTYRGLEVYFGKRVFYLYCMFEFHGGLIFILDIMLKSMSLVCESAIFRKFFLSLKVTWP